MPKLGFLTEAFMSNKLKLPNRPWLPYKHKGIKEDYYLKFKVAVV